jgi:hypothetical protein
MGVNYWNDLMSAYQDADIWARHATELQEFIEHRRRTGVKMVVVVWPGLRAVAESKAVTSKVAAFFNAAGVPALDLAPTFENRDPMELIVNKLDAHPNVRANEEVAQLLFQRLEREGYLK